MATGAQISGASAQRRQMPADNLNFSEEKKADNIFIYSQHGQPGNPLMSGAPPGKQSQQGTPNKTSYRPTASQSSNNPKVQDSSRNNQLKTSAAHSSGQASMSGIQNVTMSSKNIPQQFFHVQRQAIAPDVGDQRKQSSGQGHFEEGKGVKINIVNVHNEYNI